MVSLLCINSSVQGYLMTTLCVQNLNFIIGKKQILFDINFNANIDQVVVLLGPNGAGKTTLLKTIIGLNPKPKVNALKQHNCIYFDNQLINAWPIAKRVAHGLSYLPQHTSLFQQLSVEDNLMMVYEYHDIWKNKSKSAFIDERNKWLKQTSLYQTLTQTAWQLSGGQKRKLEVVRALLMHPRIIMFDEPFAGVDPKSIYELKAIFQGLAKSGIGIVISDHHVDQLLSIADLTYVMMQGKVIATGSIQDILADDKTKKQYLGDQFYNEMTSRYL